MIIPLSDSIGLRSEYANRHGLIAGATGSGKTTTLETLALGFSKAGVPCFIADVKGDISDDLARSGAPVSMLDVFGEHGSPFHISPGRMGVDLLARTLELSDVQAGVLEVAFAYAKERGGGRMPSLGYVSDVLRDMTKNRRAVSADIGLVGEASIAAIQRTLLRLEREGGADLLQLPTFDVAELMPEYRGVTFDAVPNLEGEWGPLPFAAPSYSGLITILHAVKLMRSPSLYAATLLFIMQDLYDRLPEVGDLDRPRLVLFLDEAHLLFQDCPESLLRRIERIVRLIRSKGVALFFCSQSPADIPPVILGQLGNRIQHGLRGATPADLRSIRAAAETMPVSLTCNPVEEIGGLGVGEALVSVVGAGGVPGPTERVKIRRPTLGEPRVMGPLVLNPNDGAFKDYVGGLENQKRGWFARLMDGSL